MSTENKEIKIRKGLDIRIDGTAERTVAATPLPRLYALKPTDYVGMSPRLLVGEGDAVKAGTPLMEDKNNGGVAYVSPVSGHVDAVVRGEKRALLAVVVASDGQHESMPFETLDFGAMRRGEATPDGTTLRQTMARSGLWTLLKQRPFGIVPRLDDRPKGVFVSGFDTSPLPVDLDFALQGREEDFQCGIDVLHHVAGTVHLSLDGRSQRNSFMAGVANAHVHFFEGPHPAGLTGTQIAKIAPINKGESVWTVGAQDVATIGHLFRCGEYWPQRMVALCGPCVQQPQYYRLMAGASVAAMSDNVKDGGQRARLVSGNVLSGTTVAVDGFLGAGDDKVSVLPEGDYYDFMGWLRPNLKKYSFSRTFVSGLCRRLGLKGRRYDIDTGRHGSQRPLFVTGEFEKLVPLEIYPMQLIKACIVGDIEEMENLGIYEVEPEDLALCEFADTSKTEIQAAIRAGLEKIRKEG